MPWLTNLWNSTTEYDIENEIETTEKLPIEINDEWDMVHPSIDDYDFFPILHRIAAKKINEYSNNERRQ